MNNYFLPLPAEWRGWMKGKLQSAGVAFCDLAVDGADGIVIEKEALLRALEILGARRVADAPSSLDGIVALTLQFEAPTPLAPKPEMKVEIIAPDGYRCDHWETLCKRVAQWAKENITGVPVVTVHYAHPNSSFVLRGGLNIVLGAAVNSTWYECVSVQPGAIGFAQMPNCPGDREFQKVITTTRQHLPLLLATGEEAERVLRQLAEEQRCKSREAYVRQCSARFEKTVAGTRDAIAAGKNEIGQLQQKLARRIREVAGAERKWEQLNACKGGELEKYGREFDKLLAVDKVRDVVAESGVIKVFTDTLYCADPRDGRVHEIGQFRIEIYNNCSNGGVRWFNLTRRGPNNHHAPHVNPDGVACYGNTAEIWPELIGNYEYAAAAMVAIQFIESVNTEDSWGERISDWPLAETGKKPEKKAEPSIRDLLTREVA